MNPSELETIDEQLTAYLDGELSAAEAADVERRLVVDERLRLRLAELRKAYDLLDELPETPHNQRFTKSTLELVIKDVTQSGTRTEFDSTIGVSPRNIRWFAWPRILILLGGVLLAGTLIGVATRSIQMVRELRSLGLIADMPGLKDVNQLSIATALASEEEVFKILRDNLSDRLLPPPPDAISQRQVWLHSLSEIQVAKLHSGREILNKLDNDSRKRYTAIQSQIESHPDNHTLQEAIQIIGLVMDSLPNSRRLDLEGLTKDQRVQFLKEQLSLKAAMFYANQMPPADTKALEEWDTKYLRPALVQQLREQRPMSTKELIGQLLFRARFAPVQLDNQEELIDQLLSTLSPTARELLSGLNRNEQLSVLTAWLYPKFVGSTQALVDAYEQMDKLQREIRDNRERFDLADPQQFKNVANEILRRQANRNTRRPQTAN